ncbi:hypothetical protein Y032_0027g1591 [Ancylostoma ceylanicum]|uniref:Ubiquitin-related modifier 1 homolog n=1 Tax=Ancylostoma ceylanicum TaxID=53326 RepID=A0A016UTU3_9BILA|nr:hypothetical protein Y032_0027g1591 [Ancylostoma ceylanicum]
MFPSELLNSLKILNQLSSIAWGPYKSKLHYIVMAGVHLNLEFSGGCEFLVGNQKEHKVTVPCDGDSVTVFELIRYVKEVMLKDCNRSDLLVEGGTVRPGVLVLVNECDWELLGCEKAELHNGDVVTFLSTLHGG